MNAFKTIRYHLYLFQLENYQIRRYLNLIFRTIGRPRLPPRKELVWTLKTKILFVMAITLHVLSAAFLAKNIVWFMVLLYIYSFVHFLFLIIASLIFWPVDFLAKQIIVNQATRRISQFKNLKIIGITGSYGKTTMKETLAAVLSAKFRVLKTPENINTPLGISRLILKELTSDTEIFIVEMGAYQREDIKALCEIAKPDIAILTGINEAHLERFGSIENTIMAKFEIVQNAKQNALVVLNGDDSRIKENYEEYSGGKRVLFYSREDDLGDLRNINIPVLGEYIWAVISACVIIAKELGVNDTEIRAGINAIKPVPHRLEPILNPAGILVIDDSYNANPEGVKEAIKVLAKYADKRKIYVTPGLVEMGGKTREIHREIGRRLSKVADIVVLIKNSVTPFIAEKLPSEKIIWFGSAQEAHSRLKEIIQPGDVILFQNDWPDNYL